MASPWQRSATLRREALARAELQSPEILADPYPVYAALREDAPVLWHEGLRRWLVARHADVDACFRDVRLSSDRTDALTELRPPGSREHITFLAQAMQKQLAFCDPPDHTRLRGLVSHTMTPRAVQRLTDFIQETVDQLVDAAIARGSMEVVADLATPLPALVMAKMLGVPPADQERFVRWSREANTFLGTLRPDAEEDRQAAQGMREAALYCFGRYQAALFRPRSEDVLSVLVRATEAGERLTTEEVLVNAVLLLAAGVDTTTQMLGTAVLSLLRHPTQWERLKTEPDLIVSALEECVRYESPFQFMTRAATEDLELAGETIRAGQTVMLLIGSANRDAQVFSQADVLDIGRGDNRHLGFGRGIHYCLGAPLARLEGQVALSTLARRLPDLRLALDTVEWRDNFELRGLTALPVAW